MTRPEGRSWACGTAAGSSRTVRPTWGMTGQKRIYSRELDMKGGAVASRMRKQCLRHPLRLRARARGVEAEMAPRGRASGRRAEVGVRPEVAG